MKSYNSVWKNIFILMLENAPSLSLTLPLALSHTFIDKV